MVTLVVDRGAVSSRFAFSPLPNDSADTPFNNNSTFYTPTAMVYNAYEFFGGRFGFSITTDYDYRGTGLVRTGTELTGGTLSSYVSSVINTDPFTGTRLKTSYYGLNLDVGAARSTLAMHGVDDGGRRVWDDIFSGNDTIIINSTATDSPYTQDINAGAGNDVVVSNQGNDRVIGGTGSNYIALGAGQDVGIAGSATETALTDAWSYVLGEDGFDQLFAGWGCNAWLDGGAQDDVLTDGFGTDVLIGGAGNDYLLAGTGTNYLIVRPQDVIAGEVDRIYYFANSNTTYLQLPTAWAGAVGTIDDGAKTTLFLSTTGGMFYVEVWGVDAAYVNAHTYYA
jgi:Ca2+-binding RTX toxin-like protein